MKRITKKITAVMACVLTISSISVGTVEATNSKEVKSETAVVQRLAGKDRMATSVEISKDIHDKSDIVVLASITGEIDSLTGTTLAHSKNAPLLLVKKNEVPKIVKDEIKRLNPETIYILGGTNTIDASVEAELSQNYIVKRISGEDRVKTSIKVAEQLKITSDEVFLTLGYNNIADALSIGPVASVKNAPILLTQKDKLAKETLDFINKIKPKKITILGGENAVSKTVVSNLPKNITVNRIGGNDRIETSVKIADAYFKDSKKAVLANGYTNADALSGGHYAGKIKAPILLTRSDRASEILMKHINNNKLSLILLGGDTAITPSVITAIDKYIKDNTVVVPPKEEDKDPEVPVDPPTEEDKEEPEKPVDPPKEEPEEPSKPPIDEDHPDFGKVDRPIEEDAPLINSKQDLFGEFLKLGRVEKNAGSEYGTRTLYYKGTDLKITDLAMYRRYLVSSGVYDTANMRVLGLSIDQQSAQEEKAGLTRITFTVNYETTDKQEQEINTKADQIIKQEIKANMTDYDKAKVLYNYMTKNVEYAKDTQGRQSYLNTAHPALTLNEATCGGFAMGYAKLLDNAGLENRVVLGQSDGYHAWNLVKINNKWYNVDTTFGRVNYYEHFLKSDAVIARKDRWHSVADYPEYLPKATDTKYDNYFKD